MTKDLWICRRPGRAPIYEPIEPYKPAEPVDVDEADEAYEIGKRDGYGEAVQDIDLLTGGDGEYVWASDPAISCPDPETMKSRIAERFHAQGHLSTNLTRQEPIYVGKTFSIADLEEAEIIVLTWERELYPPDKRLLAAVKLLREAATAQEPIVKNQAGSVHEALMAVNELGKHTVNSLSHGQRRALEAKIRAALTASDSADQPDGGG